MDEKDDEFGPVDLTGVEPDKLPHVFVPYNQVIEYASNELLAAAKKQGAIEALDELKSRLFGVEDVLEASDFIETWKDSKGGLYALFLIDELKDEIESEK